MKVENGIKIVTIGGGSSYTPELIEGFIRRYDSLPVAQLHLVDIEAGRKKLEIIGNLARRMVKKAGLPIQIFTSFDRREALINADFVTTQIRVGQLRARQLDEEIPLKHGALGQETNGAGGLFNALRTVPVMLDIAKDVAELCPQAWLINFSNPVGINMEACFRYGVHDRIIGLCNVPIHMQHDIAKLLEVDESRVFVHFVGLNHFVYAKTIYLDGIDVTSEVLELSTDSKKGMAITMNNIMPVSYEREFIRALGVLPCPYHSYYYRSEEQLQKQLVQYKEGCLRASVVARLENELFALYEDESLDVKPVQLESRGGAYYSDVACSLIDSIYNDKGDIQTVNVRNNKAVWGISKDSAVEVSARITKNGPVPLKVGRLPMSIRGKIQEMKAYERLVARTALSGDLEQAILALAINPLTKSDADAKKIVVEMMEVNRDFLPNFYRN